MKNNEQNSKSKKHYGGDKVPWIPAIYHNTKATQATQATQDRPWMGFIWMNPPYGGRNGLIPWLEKFVAHQNGICLVPDRTSAPWWQYAARNAHKVLFISGKVKFLRPDGSVGAQPSNGTCLMAIGEKGVEALRNAVSAGLGIVL